MAWFRDYIYFPLGGSRCARWKVIRNTIIVFGVSGLWHGANWTFIVWGLYHACVLSIFIILGINTKAKDVVAAGRFLPTIREAFQILVTFVLAIIGWVIFRAETLSQAINYLGIMFSTSALQYAYFDGKRALLFALIMFLIEWNQRNKKHALQFSDQTLFRFRLARWLTYYAVVVSIIFFAGGNQTFIYFQF